MDRQKLQAWWWTRQGLDGSLQGKTGREALLQAGWSRSVGGASPYVAIFARTGQGLEATHKEAADLQIHELPSARGCTHVLPCEEFGLGLKVSQGFGDDASIAQAIKFLGVTEPELEKLGEAILRALEQGPMDPKQLKDTIGDAARHLGVEGKKRGTTNTLSLGISKLQTGGHIRRIPVSGRLDRQKYSYALWRPNPVESMTLPREDAFTELARRYFHWIGPASLAHFQWFSGLGVQASKTAVSPLNLKPIAEGSNLLLLPEDTEAFKNFEPPSTPSYNLVGSIDSILNHRREIAPLFAEKNLGRHIPTSEKMVPVTSLLDLYSNAILDRGRIVGLWEYDPEVKAIVWVSFVGKSGILNDEVQKTEQFIRDELEDCRSFSLDSPESRKPKLAMLRQMAANP